MRTVRDAVFDVLAEHGVSRMFANPGSTEVDFLTDLPPDVDFVLALHEGAVVGMATGEAIASARPSLALLHTTAGYGNGVGAIATARPAAGPGTGPPRPRRPRLPRRDRAVGPCRGARADG